MDAVFIEILQFISVLLLQTWLYFQMYELYIL